MLMVVWMLIYSWGANKHVYILLILGCVLSNAWIYLIERPCLYVSFYLVSITCLQSEVNTPVKVSYIQKAKSTSVCTKMDAFLCGVPVFVWVLV